MEIIWKGNKYTNKSDRRSRTPIMIVNHISQGTAESCIEWFTSPSNNVSSTHFLVARDGKVYQFVDIKENAWGNGLSLDRVKYAKSKLVRDAKVNPNWYTVSIEHEGVYAKTKGELTEAQYQSTLELHKHIIKEVKRIYDVDIPRTRDNIVGHYEIDPIRKPFCPGYGFPFERLIQDLNKSDMFTDITNNYHKDNIERLSNIGILKGYQSGEFKPNKEVTRAELATVICRVIDHLK